MLVETYHVTRFCLSPCKHHMEKQHLGHSGRLGLDVEVPVHQTLQVGLHAAHHSLALLRRPGVVIPQVAIDLGCQGR